jgi:hypothetical protein
MSWRFVGAPFPPAGCSSYCFSGGTRAVRSRFLVLKLQLGNATVSEAPASAALTKQSFEDKRVPKLKLGNEEEKALRHPAAAVFEFLSAAARARLVPADLGRVAADRREVELQLGALAIG